MGEKHEEEERPFEPERRGSWRGSASDLVVNSRRAAARRPSTEAVYDAQGNRVHLPDVKVTVERIGYELVPLRGHKYSLAVRDVNGRYIGWMPVEVTGHPTVNEWIEAEGYVANGGRLSEEDQARLRELTDLCWRHHSKSVVEDEEGNVIDSEDAFYAEALRIINEEKKSEVLGKLDELLGGHGVEALGPVDMRDGPPYEYVNMGDTYALTVIYSRDGRNFIVSSWGDVWENEGQENVLQEAWDGHIGSDFSREVLAWFEHEEVDEESGRSRQGLTEAELDKLTAFAEEKLDEGGLAFFQRALWEAQQGGTGSGRKYPEIDFGQSEVYVHHMDAVVDEAVKMIQEEWKSGSGQTEFKYNGEGGMPTPEEFEREVRGLLHIGDRRAIFRQGSLKSVGPRMLFVNYINLPEGSGSAGGGAEAENNRLMLVVSWPRRQGAYKEDVAIPEGRLRVEQGMSVLPRQYRLRAKTGTPESVARYLADFLNRVAAEVPPKFTHTRR